MKFDKFEDNKVETILDEDDSLDFSIDKEDDWLIFKSFINYANPITSIVREIVSNAFDAHVDAGYDGDVEVEITERNDLTGTSDMFIVRDFGTGISPEIMKNIYSKFGKSTKRESNDAIGAFGFGAKSPLGYSNMFELITYVDGTKYHYAIHKGEKRPRITKLSEEDTDRENGTTVRVNIKTGDNYSFKKAIKDSLRYFEGITYINCGIENNYSILKGDGYIIRYNPPQQGQAIPTDGNRRMDLCLGKVSYPINIEALPNIDNIPYTNMGLYFDIGEIPVVWNRESVEYTQKTIETIEKRFFEVQEKFQKQFNNQWSEIETMADLFTFQHSGNSNLTLHTDKEGNEYVINLYDFIDTKVYHPKYTPLQVRQNSVYIDTCLRLFHSFKRGYLSTYVSNWEFGTKKHNKVTWLLAEDNAQVPAVMKDYFLDEYPDGVVIVKKRKFNWKKHRDSLLMAASEKSGFYYRPYDTPKDKRQAQVAKAKQLYKDIYDQCTEGMGLLKDITVPEEYKKKWEEEHKKKAVRKKERFNYMTASVNASFTMNEVQGKELKQRFGTRLVIYGFQDDRKLLRDIKRIINNETNSYKQHCHVIQISMANEKVIREELPDTSLYCKKIHTHRMFKRIGDKYNITKYVNDLEVKFQDDKVMQKALDSLTGVYDKRIPNYVTPSEPDYEEKMELYRKLGKSLKFPMLPYLTFVSSVPKKILQDYKDSCPYRNVNPILVTKLYLKNYEQEEETSNSV